jgi:UDP-2,4-diacetamido-2,4,6-trideoxy-beta-L-altropyranose hydrolase
VAVAVIADGGPGHGLGHLARCSAIAAGLRARGLDVTALAYGASEPRTLDGIAWAPLSAVPDADAIVLDTYTMPEAERAELAARAPLAFVHDLGAVPPQTALVIGAGGLAGLRYACLRAPYWGLPERSVRERVERAVVTTGGGSLRNRGAALAAVVRSGLPEASVALVRGPGAELAAPEGVEVLDPRPSLLELFLAADVVVTAAGQTALEAAATGAATVALPLVDNQRPNAEALAAADAAVVIAPEGLPDALAGLDVARRTALARNAQAAVDGYGALRIAFRVAALTRAQRRHADPPRGL